MIMKPSPKLGSATTSGFFAPKSEISFAPSPVCPPGFRNWLMTTPEILIVLWEFHVSTVYRASFYTISALLPTQTRTISFRVRGRILSLSVIGGVNDPSDNPSEYSATSQELERPGFF